MQTLAEHEQRNFSEPGDSLVSAEVLHPAMHSRALVRQAQHVPQLKHHLHGQALRVSLREIYHVE